MITLLKEEAAVHYTNTDIARRLAPQKNRRIVRKILFAILQLLLIPVIGGMIIGGYFLFDAVSDVIAEAPALEAMAVPH